MSSETIVSALFLISAVIAAGILINAMFPAIYRTSGTFGSVSQQADTRMRTDFTIVTTLANSNGAHIWMKNIGTARVHTNELDASSVFFGPVGEFEMLKKSEWTYTIYPENSNYWEPGETLEVVISNVDIPQGKNLYFQFVLPSGVQRSIEFNPPPTT